jgi:hypothetical protein
MQLVMTRFGEVRSIALKPVFLAMAYLILTLMWMTTTLSMVLRGGSTRLSGKPADTVEVYTDGIPARIRYQRTLPPISPATLVGTVTTTVCSIRTDPIYTG